jgi:hypothetical protein
MPHVETLDALLNHRILTAADPSRWWGVKIRAKKILEQSPNPDALARRMLWILSASHAQAA